MSEYGVTKTGVNIKRLDVIAEEIHADLSEGWGVNTRLNPRSKLNVLVTNFSDKLAELWEFGKDVYDAMYPSSAEGMNLDFACQYGGTVRENAAQSYYPIHCTGVDGTTLDTTTIIASATKPPKNFSPWKSAQITRSFFNKATIKIVAPTASSTYTVSIDGTLYSFSPDKSVDDLSILLGLKSAFDGCEEFSVEVDKENLLLSIEAVDVQKSYSMILTENLTTDTVTSIITFASEEFGDIVLPDRAITDIVRGQANFKSCTNLCPHIAGRLMETDTQLRQSYIDKIFNRSSRMVDSIRSAILMNCQGVESVAVYENDTNAVDEMGRWPHSVEVVVEGGDATEIAQQILNTKAGGINSYGSVEVQVPGEYGDSITIRFNRPTHIYAWMRVGIIQSKTEFIPANYVELIKTVIVKRVQELNCGDDIVPQKFLNEIYAACPGISYIDITMFTTSDSSATPGTYDLRSKTISARERATTSMTMIEVTLDG